MELHLKIVGIMLVLLALLHVAIPRFFNWPQELLPLTLITRQVVYVHTFFIAFVVLQIGVLCIADTEDLLRSRLGHDVCFGLFVFWLLRLLFQFFVYSPKVWRGKKFETVMHIIFSLMWCYISWVFFACSTIRYAPVW